MSIRLRTEVIPASGQINLAELANFLFLVQTGAAITVKFWRDGGMDEAEDVEAGYVRGRVRVWERAAIVGAAGTTVRYFIGAEDIAEDFTDYRRTVGVFQPQQPATVVDYADVDVGGVAGPVEVLPANSARFKGTIKNNADSLARIRVGSLATVAAGRGIQLEPGQSKTYQISGAVYAIRESAAAALVSRDDENY